MPPTQMSLEDVRRAITARGAKWTAGETSISRMTPDRRLGLLLPAEPARKAPKPPPKPTPLPPAPASFDWRNVDGRNYVTSVKSQAGGTCVAFANTAAVESCVLRSEALEGADIDLSDRVLAECNSGYPANVTDFLLSTGLPPEGCFTWTAAAPADGWQEQAYRVIARDAYTRPAMGVLKAAIVRSGPAVVGMNVPFDFFNYQEGIYSATTESIAGFHEVLIIGWDDQQQCFIAKNSWGPDWGEHGFFRISYGHFQAGPVGLCGGGVDTFSGVIPPRRRTMSVPVALKTVDGHSITVVNGGGLGGPNSGPSAVALHTDAVTPGPWEKFQLEWIDSDQFALKTVNGNYITAVNGGGVGGGNDASSPLHTDASWIGPWEQLTLNYDSVTRIATLQTPTGRYVTAVNGGGFGGPNNVPFHTDARAVGPWEQFTAVLTH